MEVRLPSSRTAVEVSASDGTLHVRFDGSPGESIPLPWNLLWTEAEARVTGDLLEVSIPKVSHLPRVVDIPVRRV